MSNTDETRDDAAAPYEDAAAPYELTPDQPHTLGVAPECDSNDRRLYVTQGEGWTARVKVGWEQERCYARKPGEDFFHLILHNEVHLARDRERYCLDCALRLGLLTTDRLRWQHAPRPRTEPL